MTERNDLYAMERATGESLSERKLARPREPEPRALDAMREFVASRVVEERDRILSGLIADGYGASEIIDIYVPAIARELGQKWCEDSLAFAEVTVGSARLHALVRDLSVDWASNKVADFEQPVVLVVCLGGTQHTLGSVVMASQLRRKGVSVRLILDADADDILRHVQVGNYGGIFVSAAICDRLEPIGKIVDSVKGNCAAKLPVVIGGTVLEKRVDVARATGADFATNDLDEALALCGLNIQKRQRSFQIERV